ncbi:Hypothetical protein A7982_05363 [Minicystis rosea]|nr:Hypothetical protein A7982_05363 [Minicystis rosea]
MAGAGAVFLAAAAMESCVLPQYEVGELPDAGSDAPPDTGGPACGKTYPDPPSGSDSPINNSFVMAIRAIDMGEGAPSPPGYDLDHQCTCVNDAGPTCVPRLPNLPSCDAPDGVDNAAAKLINLVAIAAGSGMFGSAYFSTLANDGSWTLLIQVSGYNGLANDPKVDVALFASPGRMGALPKWDGSDEWPVSATSVQDGDVTKPLVVSAGAYVSNNVLVAAIPSVAFTISGMTERITITMTAGVLTGTIQSQGNGWRIADGIIASRWHEPDIFAALSSYRSNTGDAFCTDATLGYPTAKSTICNSLDILKDGSGPKSLPCDSLSMGIGFKADPALLGMVTIPPTPTPGCPMATDPAFDSCDK